MAEKRSNKMVAILRSNESLINAIRRSSSEILNVAIDEVEIFKNDSALYDEIIAHRIGLIPIKANREVEEVKEGEEVKEKNEIKVTLKAKGPCTVYSGDIKGDIEVIYKEMPIVILDRDQELELVGYVRAGKSSKHSKFSAGLFYYRKISSIKIKKVEEGKKVIGKLGDKILGEKKSTVKAGEVYKCIEDIDYIESLTEDNEAIDVNEGEEIVLFIESWGQMEPKKIFNEAVKILNKNLNEVKKAIN